MEHQEKAVLFDLDGTLVDTIGDITAAINAALVAFSISPLEEAEGKKVVGNGLRNAFLRAMELRGREPSPSEVDRGYGLLMDHYRRHPTDRSLPYPGVEGLLASLSCPFGVLSNKADELTKRILFSLFPSVSFPFVLGMKENLPRKPDPTTFRMFCAQERLSPSEVLYVGDSEVDWLLSRNAGCPLVLVSWGFRPRNELEKLEGATLCATINELKERIHGM